MKWIIPVISRHVYFYGFAVVGLFLRQVRMFETKLHFDAIFRPFIAPVPFSFSKFRI